MKEIEQAKQMVEEMYSVVDSRGLSMMGKDEAKQCALIAVQMIIT